MADILLRGIDMPKENDAPILAWIYSDGNVVFFQNPIKFLRGETTGTAYGKKAKAIQLPEGYGRLIDADALERVCQEIIGCDWNHKAAPYSWAYAYQHFVDDEIENAPTIVPAEGGGEDD